MFSNVFKNTSASVEAVSFECGRIISGTTTDTICMEQTVEESQAENMFYVNTKTSQQGQHKTGKINFLVFFQICICISNQSVHISNKVKLGDLNYKARLEGFSSDNNL